jgi:hypothetical protein
MERLVKIVILVMAFLFAIQFVAFTILFISIITCKEKKIEYRVIYQKCDVESNDSHSEAQRVSF